MDKKIINKTFVRQHDSSDCGAACLLSLIRYYGGESTIQKVRERSGTSTTGTTLLGLYQAAHTFGFKAEGAEADSVKDLVEHGKPVILTTLLEGKYEHYIVCYGYENGLFIIGDPAKGISTYTAENLMGIWTRKCLLLEPGEKFTNRVEIRDRKRKWVVSLLKDDIGILFASIAIGIAISVLGMVMAVFSQKLVDDVLPSRDISKLLVGILLVSILLLGRVAADALRSRLLIMQSKNFNNRIIDFFFRRLMNLPKPFFDMRKTGDMTARLNDTRRIQTVISALAGDTVINFLVVIVSVVFLAIYSWKISLFSVVCVPVFFWIIYRDNKKIIRQQTEVMGSYAMTESNFISTITGISTIKSFGKVEIFRQLNQILYSSFQGHIYSLGKTKIRIGVFSGTASILIMIGLITYGSTAVFKGHLSIGELMAVFGIIGSLFPAVASLALVAIPVNEAKVAFERMFEIVGLEEDIIDKPASMFSGDVGILRIEDISFRFTGRRRLLENVNIKCEKGEIVCIVGESGCGKSTLMEILQGFYLPETGEITIDDTRIDGLITDIISVVPQDIYIFNGTVLDNICFGAIPEDLNVVFEFCRKYGFDRFIDELPGGVMTIVGEEGINLSGGQKQLIAFARALYRESTKILLLDEVTSAMDRRTERFICDILDKHRSSFITVFVTHRLETAKRLADRIYVFNDGKVQVSGTHEELMETNNFYSEYWRHL